MVDKITKQRVKKIDYILIIQVSGLSDEFLSYQEKHPHISLRRQAYAFCTLKKLDIPGIYFACKERGIKSSQDYLKECIRLAQDHSWIED